MHLRLSLQEKDALPAGVALREIIVLREASVVHVYDVLELGRRYRRSLVFTSDVRWCYHNLDSARTVMQVDPKTEHPIPKLIAGGPGSVHRPAQSLTITRNLSKQLGIQTFIPRSFAFQRLVHTTIRSGFSAVKIIPSSLEQGQDLKQGYKQIYEDGHSDRKDAGGYKKKKQEDT